MATLQAINGMFHIRFRFGGRSFRSSLGVTSSEEAETIKKQIEFNLHRINAGVIDPPPQNADVPKYVLTGGKNVAKPTVEVPSSPALKEMWDGWRCRSRLN